MKRSTSSSRTRITAVVLSVVALGVGISACSDDSTSQRTVKVADTSPIGHSDLREANEHQARADLAGVR